MRHTPFQQFKEDFHREFAVVGEGELREHFDVNPDSTRRMKTDNIGRNGTE